MAKKDKDKDKRKPSEEKRPPKREPDKIFETPKNRRKKKVPVVSENLNPGLKALAKERPDVVKKILKK